MLKLNFNKSDDNTYRILCLGAHCDDIEIGCGGSVLHLLRTYNNTEVTWVVFSSGRKRKTEAYESANLFLAGASKSEIIIENYEDSFFPYIGYEIKKFFENLKQKNSHPDIIFTHCRNDLHQDHRLICELTWNTYRDNLILEYEIIKYDGDIGNPNFFVHLDAAICQEKIDYIFRCFKTQGQRRWFTQDTFYSLLRLRGIESNAPDQLAEGFYCRKVIL